MSEGCSFCGTCFTSDASRFTLHASDAELLHAGFESSGIEAEDFGRAFLAAHAPVRVVQDVDDMLAFHFFERQRLPPAGFAV